MFKLVCPTVKCVGRGVANSFIRYRSCCFVGHRKKHSCGACPSFLVEPEPALGITKDHKKVFLLANSVADPYHFPGSASKFGLDPDQ